MRKPGLAVVASLVAVLSLTLFCKVAQAQDTIRSPGDHPNYAVEIEPHLNVGWFDYVGYAGIGGEAGIGLGLRASIPVTKNGFIPTINNTVAIGFGGDAMYFGCGAPGCPGTWSLYFPVVLQWNFYVAPRWSVFGEPGFSLDYAFYDSNLCIRNVCPYGNAFFPGFVFELGGRYHVNEHLALTGRIGFPFLSFGVSFM